MTLPSDAGGEPGHRLTVLGVGEVGAGWAALAAAHGRIVTLYEPDAGALARGAAAARARVAALIDAGLAHHDVARRGLAALTAESRLEAAVAGAEWIVEAAPESLELKRDLLAAAEGAVARGSAAPVLASSSSGLHASALSTGLQRPDRMLVIHPLTPVELIPVVEVIPGPATAADAVATIRAELSALGRVPVVLRREVAGNAVGRIAAAVWRECIDLVLEDVIDVADVDRLAAEGPCLGWAAGGPHLTYDLAAGDAGMPAFLDRLLPTFEGWWSALSARSTLAPNERARLAALVGSAYDDGRTQLRSDRDRRLVALVRALSETNVRR